MDKEILRRAIFIASFTSLVTFSTLTYKQEMRRDATRKYLFKHQADFLSKNYQLTKNDSDFVVNQIKPIFKNPEVSMHAKILLEYVDFYRRGSMSKSAAAPAFDRFYEAFTKELNNKKLDSLYTVLNKYSSFKTFQKERKVTELIFKKKFRNYFLDKYINQPKPEPKPPRYDVKAPKTYFTKAESTKKKPLVKRKA